eukprot:3352938-Prorocentrum_lima.AAC.1
MTPPPPLLAACGVESMLQAGAGSTSLHNYLATRCDAYCALICGSSAPPSTEHPEDVSLFSTDITPVILRRDAIMSEVTWDSS